MVLERSDAGFNSVRMTRVDCKKCKAKLALGISSDAQAVRDNTYSEGLREPVCDAELLQSYYSALLLCFKLKCLFLFHFFQFFLLSKGVYGGKEDWYLFMFINKKSYL